MTTIYGCVYRTTNLVNGKVYIGQHTEDPGWLHRSSKPYIGSGTWFSRAVAKHGYHNFECVVIETCENQDALDEAEKWHIAEAWKTYGWKFHCYNLDRGGKGGIIEHTEETKALMSASHIRHMAKPGVRESLSAKMKGVPKPRDVVKKYSAARARPFKIVSPSGELIEGVNFAQFCRDNGLAASAICCVMKGTRISHKCFTRAPDTLLERTTDGHELHTDCLG